MVSEESNLNFTRLVQMTRREKTLVVCPGIEPDFPSEARRPSI